MSELPSTGTIAPDFTAPVVGGAFADGSTVSLSDYRGKTPVILYFYPKDDTPGCTTQACAIRDSWGELGEKAAIFGVSIDSVAKHRKFIDKYELPFPLISDEDKVIVGAYGVWVEKTMYGKKYMGTARTTFVIDESSQISAVFPKVKPAVHVDQILAELAKP